MGINGGTGIVGSGAALGGSGIHINRGGGGGFDPSTLAIIAQMTTNGSTPTEARQLLINQLVLDLKGLGNNGASDVWSQLDILNVHAAADEIQAQTQWINADGTYDSVQVGTPTFTSDVGFSSTTGANRIDPIWNAATGLGNYTQNDACMGYYGTVETGSYFLGDSGVNYIRFRGSNGSTYDANFNSGFSASAVDWGSLDGMFTYDRALSTEYKAYTNITESATIIKNSGTLVSDQILYPYAFSFGGSQNCKIFFAGASIRADIEQLKASFDAYLNAL